MPYLLDIKVMDMLTVFVTKYIIINEIVEKNCSCAYGEIIT
jgi:hypothetical protein